MSHISSDTSSPRRPPPVSGGATASSKALRLAMLVKRIGQAFLAHVVQLVAQLGDLLRGGLQFAFQALGAMFHGAGGGDQSVHQLAHIGGAAFAAQLAGGGGQRVLVVGGIARRRFPACPARRRSGARCCRPACPWPRRRARRTGSAGAGRLRMFGREGLLGFDEGAPSPGSGRDFRRRHRRRTARNCPASPTTSTSPISASAVLAKACSRS